MPASTVRSFGLSGSFLPSFPTLPGIFAFSSSSILSAIFFGGKRRVNSAATARVASAAGESFGFFKGLVMGLGFILHSARAREAWGSIFASYRRACRGWWWGPDSGTSLIQACRVHRCPRGLQHSFPCCWGGTSVSHRVVANAGDHGG